MREVKRLPKRFKARDNFIRGCFSVSIIFSTSILIFYILHKSSEENIPLYLFNFTLASVFFALSVLMARQIFEDKRNPDSIEITEDNIYLGKSLVKRQPIWVPLKDIVDVRLFTYSGIRRMKIVTRNKKFELNELRFSDLKDFCYVADYLLKISKLNLV